MKRVITALVVAIEAVGILAAGLGVSLIPLTLVWMFDYELSFPYTTILGLASSAWMLGHLVPLTVELSDATVQSLGVGTEPLSFIISLAPLGITLITVWAGVALGRRASASRTPAVGVMGGLVGFAAGSWLIGSVLVGGIVKLEGTHFVLIPTLLYLVSIFVSFVFWDIRSQTPRHKRFVSTTTSAVSWIYGPSIRSLVTGLRVGVVSGIGVIGAAAIVFTLALVMNYASIMTLMQSLHLGWTGSLVVSVAEVALLPNAIVWTASWLIGPGFAMGIGSSVSPVATNVGPLPSFPLLGAIPEGTHSWGVIGILVPIVLGFVLGGRLFPSLAGLWGSRVPVGAFIAGALGAAGGGALVLGGLAWLSAGAIGPARLQQVGPDGWDVALWAAVYIGGASLLGFIARFVAQRVTPGLPGLPGFAKNSGAEGVDAHDSDMKDDRISQVLTLVVLISGSGSNLRALLDASADPEYPFTIAAVGADNPAPGLDHATEFGIPSFVVDPAAFESRVAWGEELLSQINDWAPDLVVSAGFMRILPPSVVGALTPNLINTHPALLPLFPGAHAVRDALAAGATETGATVHVIDEGVDTGPVIRQSIVPIVDGDTEDSLHERIKTVEREMLVTTVREIAAGTIRLEELSH